MGFSSGPYDSGIVLGHVPLLSRSAAVLGSTTSATYATVWVWPLPFLALGPNDTLAFRAGGKCTASSNAKQAAYRIGTNPDGVTGATAITSAASAAGSVSWNLCSFLRNLGVLNRQRNSVSPYSSVFAVTTEQAIDFSVQQYLSVTLNAAGGEEIGLQDISVLIERGTA